MSMIQVFSALLQLASVGASGIRTGEADRAALAPYRQCVLDKAAIYSKTSEPVEEIYRASTSDCARKKLYALQDRVIAMARYDLEHNTMDGQTAVGSDKNQDDMEAALRSEVSSVVLTARLKK